jgi:hypothetical protein
MFNVPIPYDSFPNWGSITTNAGTRDRAFQNRTLLATILTKKLHEILLAQKCIKGN